MSHETSLADESVQTVDDGHADDKFDQLSDQQKKTPELSSVVQNPWTDPKMVAFLNATIDAMGGRPISIQE